MQQMAAGGSCCHSGVVFIKLSSHHLPKVFLTIKLTMKCTEAWQGLLIKYSEQDRLCDLGLGLMVSIRTNNAECDSNKIQYCASSYGHTEVFAYTNSRQYLYFDF